MRFTIYNNILFNYTFIIVQVNLYVTNNILIIYKQFFSHKHS